MCPWRPLLDQIKMFRVPTDPIQCIDSLESALIGLHWIISPRTTGIEHPNSDRSRLKRCLVSLTPWRFLLDQIKMVRVPTDPIQCIDSLESVLIGLHWIISPRTTGIEHKSSDTVRPGGSLLSLATPVGPDKHVAGPNGSHAVY